MVALEEEVNGGDVRRRQVPPRRLRVEWLLRDGNLASQSVHGNKSPRPYHHQAWDRKKIKDAELVGAIDDRNEKWGRSAMYRTLALMRREGWRRGSLE